MTKRLGMFLGLGFVGVVLLLTGLAWDAVAHAHDPSLAGREGIFTLRNPGHALLGLGIGLVLVSLIGGCDTLLASAATGRWARPGVHRAFLAVSCAVVVTAAAVTSWAAGAGHDEPAGAHARSGQLASAPDAPGAPGAHPHPGDRPGARPGSATDGDPTDGPTPGTDVGGPATDGLTAGHDADGHGHPGPTSAAFPATASSTRTGSGPAWGHDAAGTPGHGGPGSPNTDGPGGAHAAAGPNGRGHDGAGTPNTRGAAGHHGAEPNPGGSDGTAPHDASGGGHEGTAPDHGGGANGGRGADGPVAPQGQWTELRYGPFVVSPAGAGGDADHANVALPSLAKPCTNCFLQEFQPDLVYADGTSANLDRGMMLHHAVLFSAGRADPTCGPNEPFPGKLGQRFFASGNERTPGIFPPGFGYYVDGGNWSGIFHVMNHGSSPATVFFRLKVRWTDAAAGGVRPLTPIWLDMNNCRTSEYPVPAGPSSAHWTWTSNLTGRIVATAGHVHDGGVRTTLSNQTTGEHICTSWAGWGTQAAYQGSIESMSGCSWDRVGTVQKGEVLDLESVYDSPKPVPDAMGIMMAFVYETRDLSAGTPAPPEVRGQNPPPVSTPPPSHHDH